jgi:glycerate dehydrogenase
MERIVFLERNTFTIDFPRPAFDHEWIEFGETKQEDVVPRLHDATIAIVNKLKLRETELAQLPRLKLIAVAATGVDNVDLEFCHSQGVAVCNTRGYAIHSLPEHVLMLILALRRNLLPYVHEVDQGAWQRANQFCLLDYLINDLHGSLLGIVGYGSLGQAVARLTEAVGMKVLVAERKDATVVRPGRTAFLDVLKESNVISLHCPLTSETRNLVGPEQLAQMKRSAILVNTARGGLVDEEALVQALRDGKLRGAGIDVLREEPPRAGNALLDAHLPNLIITPHVAWASQEAMQTLANQLIENLEAFTRGDPINLV